MCSLIEKSLCRRNMAKQADNFIFYIYIERRLDPLLFSPVGVTKAVFSVRLPRIDNCFLFTVENYSLSLPVLQDHKASLIDL